MQLYLLVLFGLICLLSDGTSLRAKISEDYYWRDYLGVIPKDALPGGLDRDKKTTYIAQVLHNKLLIPGEIVESEKRAYYEWGYKQYAATENVKIFCTRYPTQFQWVITTKDDFKTLDKHIVPGGYEPGFRIYIGRTSDGNATLGKVQVIPAQELDAYLHYLEDGKGVFSDEFEILTYIDTECNKNETSTTHQEN